MGARPTVSRRLRRAFTAAVRTCSSVIVSTPFTMEFRCLRVRAVLSMTKRTRLDRNVLGSVRIRCLTEGEEVADVRFILTAFGTNRSFAGRFLGGAIATFMGVGAGAGVGFLVSDADVGFVSVFLVSDANADAVFLVSGVGLWGDCVLVIDVDVDVDVGSSSSSSSRWIRVVERFALRRRVR